MKEQIVIFGAGMRGREAYKYYKSEGKEIKYFIDNNPQRWGTFYIRNIEIISLKQYIEDNMNFPIVIGTSYKTAATLEKQLRDEGITNYEIYDPSKGFKQGRLISYCGDAIEDVILYHLLKDENDIYYIDVGSNDPFEASVTKLLYDMKQAQGINVEPQENYITVTQMERPRDVSICMGCGNKEEIMKLYVQGTGSTFVEEHTVLGDENIQCVQVTTLKKICEKHIPESQNISFLKIDVEGAEEAVLLGADFSCYRPEIVVMEATIPRTDIPCHEKWEYILLENNYQYGFTYGINRYYFANETIEKYQDKFDDIPYLKDMYNIYQAKLTSFM